MTGHVGLDTVTAAIDSRPATQSVIQSVNEVRAVKSIGDQDGWPLENGRKTAKLMSTISVITVIGRPLQPFIARFSLLPPL